MNIITKLESEITGKVQSVEAMLAERGSQYGNFFSHASITQGIKSIMSNDTAAWHALEDDQKEALEMVAHKIGRIINGNPNITDSWKDIAGYVTLVVQRLEGSSQTIKLSEISTAGGMPVVTSEQPITITAPAEITAGRNVVVDTIEQPEAVVTTAPDTPESRRLLLAATTQASGAGSLAG